MNQIFIEERTHDFIAKFHELKEAAKFKTNKELAKKLGINSVSTISEILGLRQNIQPEAYQNFLSFYQNNTDNSVSRGTKLLDQEQKLPYQAKRHLQKLSSDRKRAVPFYDAESTATITETEMTPISAPSGTIDVGDLLHDSQAAIRIYGNSMIPNYPPGCVVGLMACNRNEIEPGEVYVIETATKRVLKRLFYKNDDQDSGVVTLYSDNILTFKGGARDGKLAYPPFDLPLNEVKRLFSVTGVIKRNLNSVIINRLPETNIEEN